ncbi:MAG: acyl carrier protein [Actinobacteria bacterium]|nr:acyl carrier protein [Actinomycetota bacterium]
MVFETIARNIADRLDCDVATITEETTFESLGIDSLDTVEMVMELEEELGFEIEMEGSLKTIGEFAEFVESKRP